MKIIDRRAYYGTDNICVYIVYVRTGKNRLESSCLRKIPGNCHLICTAPEGRKQLFTDSKTAGGHLKAEWNLLNGG